MSSAFALRRVGVACLFLWGALAASPRDALAADEGPTPQVLTPEKKGTPKDLPKLAEQRAIGFSNLIFRPHDRTRLSQDDGEIRVLLLERLRKHGFRAVGAENLVFGRDDGREAELVLGGTVNDVACQGDEATSARTLNCLIGVSWEVLDVASDEVVYRVNEYHAVSVLGGRLTDRAAVALFEGVLDGLVARNRFRALVERRKEELKPSRFELAKMQACSTPAAALPTDAERALDAVVLLEFDDGHGSGVLVSDGPFVVTAAHVVAHGKPVARFRNGQMSRVTVLRRDAGSDSALLRLDDNVIGRSCLPAARSSTPAVGSSLFVLGAPASRQLGFSMTQGITSGLRTLDEIPLVQTDASVNPGNSGGPFVSAAGEVVAIASFKLAGRSIEGVSFGIPIQTVMQRLGVDYGDENSTELLEAAEAAEEAKTGPFVDSADVRPNLQPGLAAKRDREYNESLARNAESESLQRRKALQWKRTPAYVPWLRWGGITAHALGGVGLVASSVAASNAETIPQYDEAVVLNGVSWGLFAAGLGAFIVSFPLQPDVPSEAEVFEGASRSTVPTLRLSPNGRVEMQVNFQ